MDANLQPVYDGVMQSRDPEDLFGSEDVVLPATLLLGFLARKYDGFKAITSQKYLNLEDASAAADADAQLEVLYARAQARVRNYVYGIDGRDRLKPAYATRSFEVGNNRYYLGRKLFEGDDVAIYEAFMERDGAHIGEVVIKVARDASFNDAIRAEVRNLDILHSAEVPQWKHLPLIMDRFQSAGRAGIVQRKMSGHSLAQVRRHRVHAHGVDQKHMVWMLTRALSALGYAHSQGLVHGALNPDRLIVQPRSHNALIVGWSSAAYRPATTGERIKPPFGEFSAPEVRDAAEIGPWSDIYSLGKLMIWLLGGNHVTNEFPPGIEPPLQRFILSLVTESYLARPADAWALHEQHNRIKDRLWKRKYLHFDMS